MISLFQYVLESKVDFGVVVMLFCKPGLKPGFSRIDDNTFSLTRFFFLSCSFLSDTVPYDDSRSHRNIFYIYECLVIKYSFGMDGIYCTRSTKETQLNIACIWHAMHVFSNSGNKLKTEMRKGDQVYNAYTYSKHNTSRKHLLAGNKFRPLPHSCLSRPRKCLKDLFAIPEFLWVYLKQCFPKAGLIWKVDPYCPRLDQTQGWSHGSPTVPAMPPFDSRSPNPLNVGQTLRDTTAQEKKQALSGSLHSLGKSNVPLSEKGESTFTSLRVPLGGCGSRYEDIRGPKWFCECGEVASILLLPGSCITLMKWWGLGVESKGSSVHNARYWLTPCIVFLQQWCSTRVHLQPWRFLMNEVFFC